MKKIITLLIVVTLVNTGAFALIKYTNFGGLGLWGCMVVSIIYGVELQKYVQKNNQSSTLKNSQL